MKIRAPHQNCALAHLSTPVVVFAYTTANKAIAITLSTRACAKKQQAPFIKTFCEYSSACEKTTRKLLFPARAPNAIRLFISITGRNALLP